FFLPGMHPRRREPPQISRSIRGGCCVSGCLPHKATHTFYFRHEPYHRRVGCLSFTQVSLRGLAFSKRTDYSRSVVSSGSENSVVVFLSLPRNARASSF